MARYGGTLRRGRERVKRRARERRILALESLETRSLLTATTIPILGTLDLGEQTIDGDQSFSFTPLRKGFLSIEAATHAGSVSADLFDGASQLIGASSASGQAQISLGHSVVAGETYQLRLSGTQATVDVELSNNVSQSDLLDVNCNGMISSADAVTVVHSLMTSGMSDTPLSCDDPDLYCDTSLDGHITPRDALLVIHYLITHPRTPSVTSATASSMLVNSSENGAAQSDSATVVGDSANSGLAFSLALTASGQPPVASGLQPPLPSVADACFELPASDHGESAAAGAEMPLAKMSDHVARPLSADDQWRPIGD